MSWFHTLIVVVILGALECQGYRYGAPMGICGSMYPEGHLTDARTDSPPFNLTVNSTTYSPGEVIQVNITSEGDWFLEGILVQARTLDCAASPTAIGTFQLEEGCEDFLQVVDCFDIEKSAVRHYGHAHIYNRTFYWKAPAEAAGHVYLRATVARNKAIFWMNVFSPIIQDENDSNTNFTTCPVQMQYTRQSVSDSARQRASPLFAVVALLMALLAIK